MHRLRFAPSPTGLLHVGGLRTLLYNYFYAKKNQGQLILRIEDTDLSRTQEGAFENLISTTDWLGIDFDEGPHLSTPGPHGPYFQSQRLGIYKEHVEQLLQEDHAYPCFCPPKKDIFMSTYLRINRCTCRSLDSSGAKKRAEESPHVVRLKMPTTGYEVVQDQVFSNMSFKYENLDDVIIMKSNGFPSYHLANVVDDHLMEISHVMRGAEWVSSLPIHTLMYSFFGWKPPTFAHLPLLVDESSRTKLSKRNADISVKFFRDEGYHPDALINAVSLISYKPENKEEFQTREELIEQFDLKRIHTSNAGVSLRKIGWYNKTHLERIIADENRRPVLASELEQLLSQTSYYNSAPDELRSREYIESVLHALSTRIVLLAEIPREHGYFWTSPSPEPFRLLSDSLSSTADVTELVERVCTRFRELDYSPEGLAEIKFSQWAPDLGVSCQQLLTLLRLSLSGAYKGPTMDQLVSVLGRERVCARLERSLELVKQKRELANA